MRAGLGDTRDPQVLVPGSPGRIRELARDFHRRAAWLDEFGQDLARIECASWTGAAGETYGDLLSRLPRRWSDAADSHRDAACALDGYAETLEWAQL
ncbi:MAG TPA: hypothetical protein VLJ59_00205 [Mycobacteriales bacterium]|nr:hypothetical protein [Mycobacteriales bacterium]